MQWLQLSITTTNEAVDALSDFLTAAGAVSITYLDDGTQAIYQAGVEESPVWSAVKLVALFPGDYDHHKLEQQLNLEHASWETINDHDWHTKWQAYLEPIQITNKLWICPSWRTTPDPNAINVILDPEMAFGTGAHPTTKLCLEWLANNVNPGNSMLDYGCGSGILAITAAKLGALPVYALDIDPVAIAVCANNAEKNAVIVTNTTPRYPVDIVVANILAKPLIELAPTIAELVKPGGKVVLAGALPEQAPLVQLSYAEWLHNFEVVQQGEWVRLVCTRNEKPV